MEYLWKVCTAFLWLRALLTLRFVSGMTVSEGKILNVPSDFNKFGRTRLDGNLVEKYLN